MLLPADLLLSLSSTQQSGRPEGAGHAVLPVVDVAAVQSWLDAPSGDGDNAQSDPRSLINQLLSGMTEQQSDSFAADFVHNLQALLPPEQPLQPTATLDLSGSVESGNPVQWTVDELLKFSEQILPTSQSQRPMSDEGGSVLPPGEQNLPQVLLSALAALQSQVLQDGAQPEKQSYSVNQALADLVPGIAVTDEPAQLSNWSQPVTLAVTGSERSTTPGGQLMSQPMTHGTIEADNRAVVTGLEPVQIQIKRETQDQALPHSQNKTSGLNELAAAAVSPTAIKPAVVEQNTTPTTVVPNIIAKPSAESKPGESGSDSSVMLVAESKSAMPGELARARPATGDALIVTDSVMPADRRPLAVAIDAALQSAAMDSGRIPDAAVSRQDGAALLSTAVPTAGELAQELYGADQRRQLAAQAREATVASQPLSPANRAVSDNLQMGSFGQTQWGENVSRQLMMMTANGVNSAQIRLDPPELGTLTIKVKLIDQAATVNFVSQHAMVRDALELQIPRLQEQFRQEGLNLVDVSVSDQSAQQGGSQGDDRRGGSGERLTDANDEEILAGETPVRHSSHLIDFYA
ncbi:flagellar hook-length control protein FliK [Pseudohongiella spirulinae]|uniref:Flagellar hook-length control FliK family protein n=1 Tax=Pseudohongiella spirulinae TaxID=1249552 RepID=A0A0S2KED2_9GAMM|nr:flagellar hook-length control protein FliK [Pseudohongiella spirulinae]ALO46335.1 Flagellar hook-length control FliK family protein [Pseudohongiella spirulinae]